MTTRREFIHAGLCVASAAPAALSAHEGALPLWHGAAHRMVIYDERFHESVAFGQAAAHSGFEAGGIRGDVTTLWFAHLSILWRERPEPLAGLTSQDALFCIERLAWDARMRVVMRIDHRRFPDGHVTHIVQASPRTDWVEAHLHRVGRDFGTAAADVVTRWQAGGFQVNAAEGLPHRVGEPEPLVTWLIAPLARARIL